MPITAWLCFLLCSISPLPKQIRNIIHQQHSKQEYCHTDTHLQLRQQFISLQSLALSDDNKHQNNVNHQNCINHGWQIMNMLCHPPVHISYAVKSPYASTHTFPFLSNSRSHPCTHDNCHSCQSP